MRLCFHVEEPSPGWLARALGQLWRADCEYLQAHPRTPALYKSGVRYAREPMVGGRRVEDWTDVLHTLRRGVGDCEDLAAWRAAELNVRHKIAAEPVLKRIGKGRNHYHCLVRWPNGRIEDPSRVLGMGRERRR